MEIPKISSEQAARNLDIVTQQGMRIAQSARLRGRAWWFYGLVASYATAQAAVVEFFPYPATAVGVVVASLILVVAYLRSMASAKEWRGVVVKADVAFLLCILSVGYLLRLLATAADFSHPRLIGGVGMSVLAFPLGVVLVGYIRRSMIRDAQQGKL